MAVHYIDGHSRQALVEQNQQDITTGGSADFGQFSVARYSRFTGLWSTVGSLTLRYRMGVASGAFQVSSTIAVNSGPGVIDVLNYGQFADFAITAARSTVYNLLVNGEPLR